MTTSSDNTLGLQLEQLQLGDTSPEKDEQSEVHAREKQKPYVNPERFRTGGPQREKPSDEELEERMQRIKIQNEKIKQRRLDVQADEEAFRKTQEEERIRRVNTRKVQESVDHAREQNAKRKLDKMLTREWDSGKAYEHLDTKEKAIRDNTSVSRGWSRGGSSGRMGKGPQVRGKGMEKNIPESTTEGANL
ncbi:hypothetical protein AMATHDRAFT_44182 [Amanita thiersii Skay4041]|uniref:Uncharacterized protein n=1 Tax=Amanita thiersii Skay4041 TaxID=703135 RepID=A0A2A9NAI7_9AGAR|nr:hypothetical protein AMATHDRAFT_44182 [Amanita thiersii Skay4041]